MHRKIMTIGCVSLLLLAACGKNEVPTGGTATTGPQVETLETIATASIEEMKKMSAVISKITDVESAKAAAPEIEAISRRMKELDKRGEKFGAATGAVAEKYTPLLMAAADDMSNQTRALSQRSPEARKIVDEAIKKGEQPK